MLKLDHVGPREAAEIVLDEHVPFTLETPGDIAEVIYWRAKHSNRSLLEVGLDRRDGKLRSVSLVSIDTSHVTALEDAGSMPQADAESGLPWFDVSPWGDTRESFGKRFVDEGIELRLFVGERSARLELGERRPATKSVRVDRLEMVFDDSGHLAAIDLRDLSAEELDLLRSACG